MPFIILLVVALIAPRVVVLILWFFTGWFDGLFNSLVWPILGVVFLPTTLIWYSIVQRWFGGMWTLWPLAGLVIALAIDVSGHGSYRRRRRTD